MCKHHWIINNLQGKCKYCGKEKDFYALQLKKKIIVNKIGFVPDLDIVNVGV